MHLEPMDPLALDDETAERLAANITAEVRADRPVHAPVTGEWVRAEARHTFHDRPFDGMWVVRDDAGLPVGHASLELFTWDNPHLALGLCRVHPEHRGRGAGTLLLDAQRDAARRAGRSTLMSYGFRDTPAERFLAEQGFETGQHSCQRRLSPQELDYGEIAALADEAAAKAGDYELVALDGPAADDWLPQLATLYAAINDAPVDDVDLEDAAFSVDRVRGMDAALAARRQHVYRLMARHRSTGEWAGHTVLCVDRLRPGFAMQEDTSVIAAHRGHRLGLLLKARMLLWLRDAHPELTAIDTWNADTNDHMIAVNERLGARVINRGSILQLHL